MLACFSWFPYKPRENYQNMPEKTTVAIITTDAGGMDTSKMEWWHIITVGHEITHSQLNGNHIYLF